MIFKFALEIWLKILSPETRVDNIEMSIIILLFIWIPKRPIHLRYAKPIEVVIDFPTGKLVWVYDIITVTENLTQLKRSSTVLKYGNQRHFNWR